jgi:Tfp pilus assembly protein PilP
MMKGASVCFFITLMLAGCNENIADLEEYVKVVKERKVLKIESLPRVSEMPLVSRDLGRDPFIRL